MTTVSVPLSSTLENAVQSLVKKGYGANRADVIRKAITMLVEEEAVFSVLRAEQEIAEGKAVRGDLKTIMKKVK